MMSAAFLWPMTWMYWSAIRTRLLVGVFTPAIRATNFSPVTGAQGRASGLKRLRAPSLVEQKRKTTFRHHALARAGVHKREHDALTPWFPGARHRLKLSDLDAGLIKGSKLVSSTDSSV